MLLEARGEDGRALGDEELFDHMFTLLMAGHELQRTNIHDIHFGNRAISMGAAHA